MGCTNWFDVDCQQSLAFFPHDFAFDKGRPDDYHDYTDYKEHPDYQYDDVDSNRGTQTFLGFSQPASSGLLNAGRGQNLGLSSPAAGPDFHDYEEDEDVRSEPGFFPQSTTTSGLGVIINTTPIPLGITNTRIPANGGPRVKSNINLRKKHHRGGVGSSHFEDGDSRSRFSSIDGSRNDLDQTENSSHNPFNNPPFISA